MTDICQFWPGLDELKIVCKQEKLKRNFDAEFCGIHEEAEMLRSQAVKYLRGLQLEPIRPCLMTMPSTAITM